jgi:hypothetical protein
MSVLPSGDKLRGTADGICDTLRVGRRALVSLSSVYPFIQKVYFCVNDPPEMKYINSRGHPAHRSVFFREEGTHKARTLSSEEGRTS